MTAKEEIMAKRTKNSLIESQEAQTLIEEEARARHIEEAKIDQMPAAAALFGPHPDYADGEGQTGSPSADVEREQAEQRGETP